jgi:predicted double-glycine peptidase
MSRFGRALTAVVFCAGLAAAAFARADTARAELIEGIDVERRGNEAFITVRFSVPIQYSHHTPEESGESLRIYPGLKGAANGRTRGMLKLPETDMVPHFVITYPETDDALLIQFDQPTRFEVAPNTHSITVSVPVLPGARDWVVITRDWSITPYDHAAALKAALAASAAEANAREEAEIAAQEVVEPPAEPGEQVIYESGVQLAGFAGGGSGHFNLRVDSMKQVRFGTVVRQEQDWSCGSAAVATLLTYHYNHPMAEAEALKAMFERGNQAKIRRDGFSLLDMKMFLESLGYKANGFQTSLDRLAKVNVPAIVIINDSGYRHFVVVKGLRHGNVLLGDPAKGNRVVSRSAFEAMWESRIVFVITSRREGVAFNFSEDWRFMAAPFGDAVSRDSLASALLVRPGPNDF